MEVSQFVYPFVTDQSVDGMLKQSSKRLDEKRTFESINHCQEQCTGLVILPQRLPTLLDKKPVKHEILLQGVDNP